MGFMFKAAGLGFGVAKPWGDSERYDYILDSGQRLWRVQVKSTYVARTHSYTVHSQGRFGPNNKAYTAEQIDMLVAYIVAEDAWYVIPVAAFVPRTMIALYPSGSKKRNSGRYEKYREAWALMKAGTGDENLQNSQILGHLLPR
jgi:hypothetical protein